MVHVNIGKNFLTYENVNQPTGRVNKPIGGGDMGEVLIGKQVIIDTSGDKWWFDTKTAK